MTRHLDIVGLGVGGIGNLTLETNHIIATAERLFSLVAPDAQFNVYLKTLAKSSVDLSGFYTRGATPSEVYGSIVHRIIGDQTNWTNGVLVTDGNPQLFDNVVRRTRSAASQAGWTTTIHPGVSCLDTLMIDLDLHVEEGLQVLDAARMLLWNIPILDCTGCLILQLAACSVGYFVPVDEQRPEMFFSIRDWLLKFHKKDHPLIIIRSRSTPESTSKIINTTVVDFPSLAKGIDYRCSAYVPPGAGSLRLNEDFALKYQKKLGSQE